LVKGTRKQPLTQSEYLRASRVVTPMPTKTNQMTRLLIMVLTALLPVVNLFAQNLSELSAFGFVFDESTGKPLPYANVLVKGSTIGTVTNLKGEFRISIPTNAKSDSLSVSYVGYKTNSVSITGLSIDSKIFLSESEYTLDEVQITGQSALSIMKSAIQKIPANYYTQSYKSKGFYRVASKRDAKYMHLSEAVFELHNAKKASQVKLLKMRAIKDEKESHGLDLGLKPQGLVEFDIINHSDEFDFLTEKGLKDYVVGFEDQSTFMDQEVFVLSFDQKDGAKKAGYKGKVFIDTKTYAIVYLDYGFSPKGIKYHKFGDVAERALMKILDIHIEMPKSDYKISYKRIGDKYYLNAVSNNAVLLFQSRRYHYNFLADTRVDYIVSDLDFNNTLPFDPRETLGNSKLIEEQDSPYDKTFWDGYTIILPNTDFTSIAKIIESNNKANDTQSEIEAKLLKYPKDKAIRMDSILSFYNQKGLFNGNALIEYEGEIFLQKSYNNAITENHLQTQFRIGSVSKTFTSMLIMMLEKDGLLSLTDSVKKYLPSYRHPNITIEQLLTHQSGLPNYLAKNEYVMRLFEREYSAGELVEQFCSDSLEFDAGTNFQYSNSGYVVLSHIIEKVSGKTFGEVLEERIFRPLHMNDTYFGVSVDTANLAVGYLYGQPEPTYYPQNVSGAGGITSTLEDLLKWSHSIDEETLLPTEELNALFVPRASYSDWEADYGYGWMVDKYKFKASKKHVICYHPGTDFGFYSMFVKQPDKKITLILLSNTGDFPRFEISDLILNVLN
jgi:CubicO group peptidase (beta-lactamase class C family)